jgi:acyl-CoA synthetase (AMP-forming)/AMP-acid ligase II
MALAGALNRSCELYPEKTAVVAGDESWTYGSLAATADQLAAGLLQAGIRPGDRVALHFLNCPELVLCDYACFTIGAVVVPLNIRLKSAELA